MATYIGVQFFRGHGVDIILMLLRRIGIPLPTVPPGESLCIKTGNQIRGWVFSRFDHVIRGRPK